MPLSCLSDSHGQITYPGSFLSVCSQPVKRGQTHSYPKMTRALPASLPTSCLGGLNLNRMQTGEMGRRGEGFMTQWSFLSVFCLGISSKFKQSTEIFINSLENQERLSPFSSWACGYEILPNGSLAGSHGDKNSRFTPWSRLLSALLPQVLAPCGICHAFPQAFPKLIFPLLVDFNSYGPP